MIRVISSTQEIGNQPTELEIEHPLWHGRLKVVALPPQQYSGIYGFLSDFFWNNAPIPVGNGLYADPENRRFIELWNLYKKSGKTFERFQVDALKSSDPVIPKEAKIAAALSLSKGKGFHDQHLVVQRNWRDVADDIAVIFTQKTKPIGKGSFGVVSEATGLVVRPIENKISETTFALKSPVDEDAKILLTKGLDLLKKIWGPGLVEPSVKIFVPTSRGGLQEKWAMTPYTADLRAWAKINRKDPLKIVKAFLTAFCGLKILQDNLVVHLDLKPQNLLVMEKEEGIRIDINDFDACFALPTQLDPKSLADFKENLVEFSIIRTPYYSRSAETKKMREHLTFLKTLLETEEKDRDSRWFFSFSERLADSATLLQQIQIYEWGWSLIVSLTDTPPLSLLPTAGTEDDDKPKKEPSSSKVENLLKGIDVGLRGILFQAIDPVPGNRPSLDTFRDSIREYLESKETDIIVSHGRTFNDTVSLKPLLGKGIGG